MLAVGHQEARNEHQERPASFWVGRTVLFTRAVCEVWACKFVARSFSGGIVSMVHAEFPSPCLGPLHQ